MKKALEDVRVLACTHVHAGAYCSRLLAELGAEVIRIEPPTGSITRRSTRHPLSFDGDSFFDVHFNAQHKFITLNLKHEKGKQMFLDMIKKSDVFVENYAPHVFDKLGIGYEVQKKVNPKIIYASIKVYGNTGPDREEAGFDYAVQARSGLMELTGWPDRPPLRCGIALADHHAGVLTALSILAALHCREKVGKSQFIDMGLFDAAVDLVSEQVSWYFKSGDPSLPTRYGNNGVFNEIHPDLICKAKDGYLHLLLDIGYGSFTALNWKDIFKTIGREDLIEDERYNTHEKIEAKKDEVYNILADWVKTKTKHEAYYTLREKGFLCAPVQTIPEMFDKDPQVKARKMYIEVEHPVLGKVKLERSPLNLSETPGTVEWPGMPLGYHNEEVYRKLFGYDKQKVAELKRDGVI